VVVALIAVMALLLVPASASATSPVLEFVVPSGQAVNFGIRSGAVIAEMADFGSIVHCSHTEGEGKITGPRTAVARFDFTKCVTKGASNVKCQTEGAIEEEITTGYIDAELVYIDQATHQVGILMNPGGGVYMSFKCGGEAVEAKGAFLAPVSPINQVATSFTATLSQSGSVQAPDIYENENGVRVPAIPTGNRPGHEFVPTGVTATMTIETDEVPVEIKSVTTQDIEVQQHAEEAKKQEATLKQLEEAVKKAEERTEEVADEVKKHEEQFNIQVAEAKKRQEQLNAQLIEAKKHEEQADAQLAEATRKLEEAEKARSLPPTRAQLLTRALGRCKQQPKKRQARCVANAYKKYGKAKQKGRGASTGLAATWGWAKS
jgi:hypothetical protein